MSHCYLHMASRQYIDDILLISCFHVCAMSCPLFMPTICTHDMLAMIPSSMLHLRTTSLLDLITIITCFVASPMLHSYSLSWVDDIYVHASHMIYLDHCLLCPLVASFISTCIECNHTMLIDLGDFDTLLVMHACLIEPIVLGCSCIICLHIMKNVPLSFLMTSMMHTLVGYLTTRMIGFAFSLTSFVFPSVCHFLSF